MGAKAGTKKSAEQSRHPAIEVKDFGPIAQGKVELRPLTVFAGPSNTGKTWLATLAYALFHHNAWNNISFNEHAINYPIDKKLQRPPFPENFVAWFNSIKKGESIDFTKSEKQFLESFIVNDGGSIKTEIQRCFGLSGFMQIVRQGVAGKAQIKFRSSSTDVLDEYSIDMTLGKNHFALSTQIPDSMHTQSLSDSHKQMLMEVLVGLRKYDELFGPSSETHVHKADSSILMRFYLVFYSVLHELHSPNPATVKMQSAPWYLPADRGGIMHTHHALVGSLIQNASRPWTHDQSSTPGLSGIVTDFLENLTRLGQMSKEELYTSPKSAKALESNVIGGKVLVENNPLNYPSFHWQPKGWESSLPLMNTSSMVSELAPVALYLRHYVRPGDLLIIDEPEAHLHPSRQVDFINEIAGWVRSGIRVILTTHSDWVLEALSNLVAESQLEEHLLQDKVAESQAGEGAGLRKEDVGFWLFEQGKRGGGAKIREVPWDADEGGFEADFYDTAANLHNRWAVIMGKIENE